MAKFTDQELQVIQAALAPDYARFANNEFQRELTQAGARPSKHLQAVLSRPDLSELARAEALNALAEETDRAQTLPYLKEFMVGKDGTGNLLKAPLSGLAMGLAWPVEKFSFLRDIVEGAEELGAWVGDRLAGIKDPTPLADRWAHGDRPPDLLNYPISRRVDKAIGYDMAEAGLVPALTSMGSFLYGPKALRAAPSQLRDLARRTKNRYRPDVLPPEASALPMRAPRTYDAPITNPRLMLPAYAKGGAVRALMRTAPDAVPKRLAPLTAVKEKGGNWGGLRLDQYVDDFNLQRRRPEVQDWANKQLKRYVKTYLGTAEDPMLQVEREQQLAGNPGLHLGEEELQNMLAQYGAYAQSHFANETSPSVPEYLRKGDAFHRAKTGRINRTPWERLADGLVEYQPSASDLRQDAIMAAGLDLTGAKSIEEALSLIKDPAQLIAAGDLRSADDAKHMMAAAAPYRWLDDLLAKDPDARLYDINVGPGGDPLGIQHVLDYLDQSGLTRDQLQRVTYPDAVRGTIRWDQELKKKRAADPRYLLEGTAPVKEYDNGWRWVDVQAPEALKLEGDEMGHCVGGYCEAVRSGSTRILSLRDPEGRPHFTVEVSLPKWAKLDMRKVMPLLKEWEKDHKGFNSLEEYVKNVHPDRYEKLMGMPPSISQLKPAENSWSSAKVQGRLAKDPEYKQRILPMVQDLVRTMGPWGGLRDLSNAELIERADLMGTHIPERLRDKLPQHLRFDTLRSAPGPELMTEDELLEFAWNLKRPAGQAFNETELANLSRLGRAVAPETELTEREIDALQKLFTQNRGD